jgi:DNA-binding protein HU-beta
VFLNKSELVDVVANAAGVDKRKAEAAVDAIVGAVIDTTRSGGRVSIFGFGTFSQTSRAARMGRNPRTGDPVPIAASTGVKFAPSTAFKSTLNAKSAKKAAAGKKATARKSAGGKKAAAKKTAAKKSSKSSKRR